MKGACLVTLLFVFFGLAYGKVCSIISGKQCCGLTIVALRTDSNYYFAQQNGYFADENLTVCVNTQTSSVTIYDTLLAGGQADLANTQVDNGLWRRLNFSTPLSIVGGGDGQRGFYLLGNTHVLGGHDGVEALSGKNIVVDSPDSGYVVGVKKVLADFGVTNYSLVSFGTNRLGIVQQGNLSDVPIAATMQNNIAPYMVSYPVVTLAKQTEHFCPAQGTGYIAYTSWVNNATNYADLVKYFRALLRSYQYQIDPKNNATVKAYIASNAGLSDPNLVELQYDDLYNNPASGLNPNLVPKKTGLRNQVSTRIAFGLSPYPKEGLESFISNKPGGMVDLRALQAAQASLGLTTSYDVESTLGCPAANKGTITTVPAPPPTFTCSYDYEILSQPPYTFGTLTATLTVTVSNSSLLKVNGNNGWTIQFTAKGHGSTNAFKIDDSWGTGSVTYTSSGVNKNYTLTNAIYNTQNPTNLGWIADTSLSSPYNNICGLTINGVQCSVSNPSTSSLSC